MSEQSRPGSRWSASMSVATKATNYTTQTIPLTNIRRKLFRNAANNQRTYAQRLAKSKRDIEELFRLYYSNDIKFDTIHRQIVTGNSNYSLFRRRGEKNAKSTFDFFGFFPSRHSNSHCSNNSNTYE